MQTRTVIWIAIIVILFVCVGLVYTAGVLLVGEAGGHVSRIDGSNYTPGDFDLVCAATPQLLAAMREELEASRCAEVEKGAEAQ